MFFKINAKLYRFLMVSGNVVGLAMLVIDILYGVVLFFTNGFNLLNALWNMWNVLYIISLDFGWIILYPLLFLAEWCIVSVVFMLVAIPKEISKVQVTPSQPSIEVSASQEDSVGHLEKPLKNQKETGGA